MKKYSFLLLIILTGCNSPSNVYNQEYSGEIYKSLKYADLNPQIIQLNDSTRSIIENFYTRSSKEILSDSKLGIALFLCDSIIELDSTFLEAYFNKSLLFRLIDSIDGAIEPLEIIDDSFQDPKAYFLLGVYYALYGYDSLSRSKFEKSVAQYKIYSEYPTYNIDDMHYRAEALLFLKGKKEVLRDTRKLLFKYPFDYELRLQRKIARNFDRERFLSYY